MQYLKAAYINELYKISKKKKIIVAAILSLAALVVAGIIVSTVSNFMGINVTGSSEFSILVLPVLNYTLFPLFTAFVAIDMVAGEFADGTIKTTLTRPATRFQVYLAKALAVGTFILANLLFVMVTSMIGSLFLNPGMMNVGSIFIAYLVSFLPLFVFALMVMLIANFAKNTWAFLLSLILYLAFIAFGFVWPNYQSFFFTSAFNWYTLFIGGFFNVSKVLRVFFTLSGFSLALFGAGYYLFDKRDI